MKNATTIEVCERIGDRTWDGQSTYHAQIQDRPDIWACGINRDDAIGNLVRCHPEEFGVEIVQMGKMYR